MKSMNSNRGFSLVELVVVIAVLGVLSSIALPASIGYAERARISVDRDTVRTLNIATALYAADTGPALADVFEGHDSDDSRLALLVAEGFFSLIPRPQFRSGQFVWHVDSQQWLYSLHAMAESPLARFVFSETSKADFTFNSWGGGGGSTWSITQEGLAVTGSGNQDMLFIGNDKSTYTLNTQFTLASNPGENGGLGIFFETVLNENSNNRDTGYILQFDRGFSEIVLRKRVDGRESNSSDMLLARIGNRSTSTITNAAIPHKSDSSWWEASKDLSLSVKDSGTAGVKLLTVVLDGEVLLKDFQIASDVPAINNHTGFRAWNNQGATIAGLKIE